MIKLLEGFEIPRLFDILSDPAISQNLVADTSVLTVNNLFSWLLMTQPGTTSTAYSIYSDDALVGVITLNNISLTRRSAFVGILAVMSGVKPGVGLNACRWILAHCFDTLGLNRVYGHTWADNERMDALYRRLGGTLEGIEREHTWKNGRFVDMKIWSILAREYYGSGS
jgi:RimJ/RimL family protein N-acetyltransferase